ncbi:MAG: hypothetical protein KatS3mg101_1024 [Patescibacteria group bacterium]|nr:MAG: hypothetical protein KatS3mg101_1024 [Patescibacteria group bacterium]
MTKIEEIKQKMNKLVKKWQGKPEAPFMSKEYIERRMDRILYRKLLAKLNQLEKQTEIIEEAKKIFEIGEK